MLCDLRLVTLGSNSLVWQMDFSTERQQSATNLAPALLAVQPPPFSIYALNDDVVFVTLVGLYNLGADVPEAVRVMGHDNSAIAELTISPLTTVGFTSSDLTERLITNVVSVL